MPRPPLERAVPKFDLPLRGLFEFELDLETTPSRPVEQLRVVAGRHHDHVARQRVDLQQ